MENSKLAYLFRASIEEINYLFADSTELGGVDDLFEEDADYSDYKSTRTTVYELSMALLEVDSEEGHKWLAESYPNVHDMITGK